MHDIREPDPIKQGTSPDISPGRAVAVSVVGYAMDGFDLLILSFMLPAISEGLKLTGVQSGSLVTATLLGAVGGGVIFGVLSDHLGRVKVLAWTILLFAVFTGLCALAQGYWDLLAYRTIAGFGLGGEFGIGMTLVAETWPARQRARATSYVGLGWQAGALVAALCTPWLLPLIGWRGMFAIGLLPAAASYILRRTVGEPKLFTNQRATPLRHSLTELFSTRRALKSSIAVATLCSVQNFGYYGLMVWLPGYLSKMLGYSATKSSLWVVVTILGMCAGILVFGQLADRIGRRRTFLIFQAGAAAMVLVYSQLTSPFALLLGGAGMGVFVNGMIGGYGALIAELFPTSARATAQNVLFNFGRGVGGFGPLVIGILATQFSPATAIAFLATAYILDMVVVLLLVPETKGLTLE